ncbi:MAG: toprim domain-containing protein [Castellaniella sp.]|nr:toprim domain-containing protein [Castellaniella sp.]
MNAHELSRRLADSAANVAQHLLPQGKKQGREWKAGSTKGEAGQSLSVCVSGEKAGVWSDFSTGETGDLLDLWVAVRGGALADAIRDAKAYLGVRDDMPERAPRKAYSAPAKPKVRSAKGRVLSWLNSRGLTDTTVAAFKVSEQDSNGKVYALFPYLRDGKYVNGKYRNIDDKKDMRQEGGAEPCLFGWDLIAPNARMVCIAEGEIDAMTLHQAGLPALSVNAGAGNHQWIESDWERLEQFSDIVLCYDNDEVGRKGAREVAQRLGIERCRVCYFGEAKDANEYIQSGATEEPAEWVKRARYLDPDELRSAADFMAETKALFYPAPGTQEYPLLSFCGKSFDFWEWRPAQVSVWTGINGHGKSLMLMQALIPVMMAGVPICVFSGELPPPKQLKRLAKQITGIDRAAPAFLDYVAQWLRDRMWIFNTTGVATLDRLLEVFGYGAKRYGIKHFVIDSLMMTDVPEDGPGAMTAQRKAMARIVAFAHAADVHVHLVAHPRKAIDEKHSPGKLDVAGSGHITNGADNVFAVWSANKEPGEGMDTSDAKLEILKDRDDVGRRTIHLFFNRQTNQYTSDPNRRGYTYLKGFSTNQPQQPQEHDHEQW